MSSSFDHCRRELGERGCGMRRDLLQRTCLALVVEFVGQQTLHAGVHPAAIRSAPLVSLPLAHVVCCVALEMARLSRRMNCRSCFRALSLDEWHLLFPDTFASVDPSSRVDGETSKNDQHSSCLSAPRVAKASLQLQIDAKSGSKL